MTDRKLVESFCHRDFILSVLCQVPAFGWKSPEPSHPHGCHHVLPTPPLHCLVEESKYATCHHTRTRSRINLRQISLHLEQEKVSATNKMFTLLYLVLFGASFLSDSGEREQRVEILT